MKKRASGALPLPKSGYPRNHDLSAIFRCERIERRPIASIKPNPRHARKHSDRQLGLLLENIREFGDLYPILVDEDGIIIDGHARLSAYQELGFEDVTVIEVPHLSTHQKRLLAISCNRLAELGEWNLERLSIEFKELLEIEDIELDLTGFATVEIDEIVLKGTVEAESTEEETVPLPDTEKAAVTQAGDLWSLGDHRLFCGSALEQSSYDELLRGQLAQMVATDPPYNVAIDGHVSGLGRTKHREFAMASGEMSGKQFREFLLTFLTLAGQNSDKAAIIYAFMDWRHIEDLLAAGGQAALEVKNLCVWVKTNAGMGAFYRSHHELVAVFKSGAGNHINNFGLGKKRYRTNVWQAPGVNTFRPGRMKDLEAHPTCKPISLYVDMMRDCSKRKGIVLDPFAGSGTVFLAAERAGRVARGIELDPHYCDVAIRRWQDATGQKATHAVSGRTFDEMPLQGAPEGRLVPDTGHDETREG